MYNLKTINKKISEILDRIDLAKSNNNDRKVIEYINALEEAEDIKEGILESAALETKQKKDLTKKELTILFKGLIDLKSFDVFFDESTSYKFSNDEVNKLMDKLNEQIQIK